MGTMQLVYTPRSHFSRKVRLLADALGLELALLDAGNVAAGDAAFGPNPLMKVPTLLDGDRAIFDSDHIAAWLVRRHDPADRFGVLSADPDALNARAVMNGVMGLEVELILAERTGLGTAHPRFDKMRDGMRQGLEWLEANERLFPEAPSYLGFHLVAMWDHLAFYGVVPMDAPRLRERVAGCSAAWPFAAASRPA
jgi:glutathione S-transferase